MEKTVGNQKRWIEEGNTHGEYYLLDSNGNLSIYDEMGIIKTMQKMR